MISLLQPHSIIKLPLKQKNKYGKKSKSVILLLIPDLWLKHFSVQELESIPWVVSTTTFRTQEVLLYPSRDRAVGLFVLLQLNPLTSMMSLHSAKHWEMFHFSLVSKSIVKIFKTFTRRFPLFVPFISDIIYANLVTLSAT